MKEVRYAVQNDQWWGQFKKAKRPLPRLSIFVVNY